MKSFDLIVRSAVFYWRTHLGVLLGTALAAMVLTGALLVGDSVKATLRKQAELRIGKADVALTAGDRSFRAQIAEAAGPEVAPVLMLNATIARGDGAARVNTAQMAGVDERFWKLSPSGQVIDLPADGVALNARLAQELGVKKGDIVVIRMEKPGMFSKDAPLSGEEGELVALRSTVVQLVEDRDYGRFALSASQVPPFTIFAPLRVLQERSEATGKANLLLGKVATSSVSMPWLTFADQKTFGGEQASAAVWNLADTVLELRELEAGGIELRSPRVFLDPPVLAAAPPAKDGRRVEALTYLVNELRAGEKATPYSMVTAVETASSGFLPAELADDEIVINQWLAEDLGIATGAKLTIKYYVMGERRQLTEEAREFTVLAVLPMNEPALNTSWMPEFPGLHDAENCRDWKPGFEMDLSKMRAKDEAYWDEYRGTPKAFVNLKVGQEMWGNRWGNVTSIHWPSGTDPKEIEAALLANLSPAQLGFQFIPLRQQALAATEAPVDFGQLFVSFSFFLIIAAAVLTGLLFTFTIEQRTEQIGTMLAIGLPPRQVRALVFREGLILAIVGALAGSAAGVIYTQLVLRGLATVWRGAVGMAEFEFAAQAASIIGGVLGSVAIAAGAMWLASRRLLRRTARELMSGQAISSQAEKKRRGLGERLGSKPGSIAVASTVAAIVLAVAGGDSPGVFFGAGALLLIGGLFGALYALRRFEAGAKPIESLGALGVSNATRRRGRSLATITVLASGVFMVVAVDSFRHGPQQDWQKRGSGTGGFALVGESASPIYEDLNSEKGRDAYGLDPEIMEGVRVVQVRVREGDDASCLNLNKALQPRLLGVKPGELSALEAFAIKGVGREVAKQAGDAKSAAAVWPLLDAHLEGGAVPAIVDGNTLQWALKMSLGDEIEYRGERGEAFPVRMVAALGTSILQGQLLVSEEEFVRRFPNTGGYRFFLVDCPPEKLAEVREHMTRQLEDRGLELTPTVRRLAEFHAVENTYLAIFQVLGGLGVLLGSAGLAIVVARNVLERRREFGLLAAVGFRPRQLRRLVFVEHRWLIVAALLIGAASACVAVWPQLAGASEGFPWRQAAGLLVLLGLGCLFWTWISTRLALRGSGLSGLRAE